MLKQRLLRSLFRISTRRLTLLLALLSCAAITFIISLSAAIPQSPSLSDYDHRTKPASSRNDDSSRKIPLDSLQQPPHAPPRQKDDEYGGSSWWTDWKWLAVPFSSSLTSDNRALLPPLRERPPIYCYRDNAVPRSREQREAEGELLLTWRRAWWSQGFRPIILSAAEALKNPMYDTAHRSGVEPALRLDLMRWLAWDTMGGGLLAETTMIPMDSRDDPWLIYLRQGQYAKLRSWKSLGSALLAGPGTEVNSALKAALESSKLGKVGSVLKALPDGHVTTHDTPSSLAYYSPTVIEKRYSAVAQASIKGSAQGLRALAKLINSHLHTVWQNNFPRGIELLKPFPLHTTKMVSDALALAESLVFCSESPMPNSCPPNNAKCTPCSSSKRMKISTTPYYHNYSETFALGIVPHPWTLATLNNVRDTLDIAWIRQESIRDPWVMKVTDILTEDEMASSDYRVVRFKESVASDYAASHALWLIAEDPVPSDLSWHFGFAIPAHPRHAEIEVQPLSHLEPSDDPALEWILLERAKQVVAQTKPSEDTRTRASLEAWNLADMEAWKFTKAFQARRTMERADWEKEESKYGDTGWGGGTGRRRWKLRR